MVLYAFGNYNFNSATLLVLLELELSLIVGLIWGGLMLNQEHFFQLQYQLPLSHTKLPVVFREMERAKARSAESGLEDYSITQTTLDEVQKKNFFCQNRCGLSNG